MKRLIAAALAALFLLSAAGCGSRTREKTEFQIVTSFYPIYIMALNLAQGVPGVRVENLAGQQAGCLHDYQLQTSDMQNLEQADVFLINGAGMESFLEKVTEQIPGLTVVDGGEGIARTAGEDNPHLWVSITNCMAQVKNLSEGLQKADPAHAAQYAENAQLYLAKLAVLRQEMHEVIDPLPNRNIVTFHEAFPYFAQEFGLNIVRVVNREPDSQPSARELAETIRLIEESGVRAVFAEPQYPRSAADIVAGESGAKVYQLDPGVTGPEEPDAYLNAMRQNLEVLKEALS